MNPYQQMVSAYAGLAREGKGYPLGGQPRCERPQIPADAPKVLIFSPHPDDEVIIGALALRLLRQSRWNVNNVAVTLGSRKERQAERLAELKACCECIGFGLIETAPNGLERVNPRTRNEESAWWVRSVKVVAELLQHHQPRVIFVPHDDDGNSTHVGTHLLVLDALKQLPAGFHCFVVETEFWRAMSSPNLMVEVAPAELGDLITALSFHIGEVKRNPYHLSLPAWMIDNVRRGAELVGGQGGAAPDFTFATLYRLRRWMGGRMESGSAGGKVLRAGESPEALFELRPAST